jgi:hypothetical protein
MKTYVFAIGRQFKSSFTFCIWFGLVTFGYDVTGWLKIPYVTDVHTGLHHLALRYSQMSIQQHITNFKIIQAHTGTTTR